VLVMGETEPSSRLRSTSSPSAVTATARTLSRSVSVAHGLSGPHTDIGGPAARSPLSLALSLAASRYAGVYGWPIECVANEVVVECGSTVDILAIPMGLAGEVNHLLKLHNLSAPVMEIKGVNGSSWAFFCSPRDMAHGERAARTLALHRIEHFGTGARVPLPPSPACNGHELRWVVQPSTTPLPLWAAVASCALQAIRR
jgi:hypothetical protein